MTGFEFIDQYSKLLKDIRRLLFEVSGGIFDLEHKSQEDYLVLELSLKEIPLINDQRQRLIILPRGGGNEVLQDIVDHAYEILYLCVSISSRLGRSDVHTDLERVIYFYISLMENVVIEEAHERQIQNCYEASESYPFIYVREEHSRMFFEAMKSAVKRGYIQDFSGIFWLRDMEENEKTGRMEGDFSPECFLSGNLEYACALAEKNDYIKAYSLLDEIVSGGVITDKKLLAQGFYNVAEIFRNQKMYDQALVFYRRAVQLAPDLKSWIWANMGVTYISMDNWEEAYQCMQQALRIDAYDLVAVENKVLCLCKLERMKELRDYYFALLKLYDKQPLDGLAKTLGYICYVEHDFAKACGYLEKYISKHEDDWEYLYYYAMGLYYLHDTTNARLHLQKAVNLMEKDADGGRTRKLYLTVSYYHLDAPDLDRAIKSLEECQEKYGSIEQLDFLDAVMYMDDSVEEEYWQLIQMGKKYFFEDNGDFFREDFIKELQERRRKWENWFLNTPRKMMDGEISALTRKLLIQSYIFEGCAYSDLMEHEKAIEMYDNALYWDASCPEVLYDKGLVMFQCGKYYEAIELYEKALRFQKQEEKRKDIEERLSEAKLRLDGRNVVRLRPRKRETNNVGDDINHKI